ncbi:MAG: hypothetical protein H6744_12890 [Deltaproteobacteria bacterium]|nr:hypothetical protein [Deltaproteobacteria bacterium]MCB9787570.1 hypothetical protein [Deltaproteobacteria bacterium]
MGRGLGVRGVAGLAATLGCVWIGACENDTNVPLNKLPTVADGSADSDVSADGGADSDVSATCECATVGDWYRFTELALDTIAGGENPLLPILNGIWAKDIANYDLNILFRVEAVSDSEVTLRAVSAARVGALGTTGICVLPGTEFDVVHPRSGCALGDSARTGINVYAGTTALVKNCAPNITPEHAIPARDLVLKATVAGDCSHIVSGTVVSGVISESALDSVCSCIKASAEECGPLDPSYDAVPACKGCGSAFASLKTLLKNIGQIDTYEAKTSSGEPAVAVTGHFQAVRLDSSPPNCP